MSENHSCLFACSRCDITCPCDCREPGPSPAQRLSEAWSAGFRAGVEVGESGYEAGTDRHLCQAVNPYRVIPPAKADDA